MDYRLNKTEARSAAKGRRQCRQCQSIHLQLKLAPAHRSSTHALKCFPCVVNVCRMAVSPVRPRNRQDRTVCASGCAYLGCERPLRLSRLLLPVTSNTSWELPTLAARMSFAMFCCSSSIREMFSRLQGTEARERTPRGISERQSPPTNRPVASESWPSNNSFKLPTVVDLQALLPPHNETPHCASFLKISKHGGTPLSDRQLGDLIGCNLGCSFHSLAVGAIGGIHSDIYTTPSSGSPPFP